MMFRAPSRRLFVGVLVILCGLAACGGASRVAAPELRALPGGDFTLTDHNGQPFASSSLRGKVVLIFFGYTSCPDACPTTLSKLASVSKRLGADRARVKTLYVSVDPDRDTPAVLKADLANFDVDALGLTGTKVQIDRVVGLYGASYVITPTPESAAKYTVAHTASLFAVDAKGQTRLMFRYEASVDEIVTGIRAILSATS